MPCASPLSRHFVAPPALTQVGVRGRYARAPARVSYMAMPPCKPSSWHSHAIANQLACAPCQCPVSSRGAQLIH